MTEAGIKFDEGKLRYDLIPPVVDHALATVLTEGAKIYGDNNWMEGLKYRRVYAAVQRHLAAWRSGDTLDRDSGKPHLWHALTELAFLIHFESRLDLYDSFNDFIDEWNDVKEK